MIIFFRLVHANLRAAVVQHRVRVAEGLRQVQRNQHRRCYRRRCKDSPRLLNVSLLPYVLSIPSRTTSRRRFARISRYTRSKRNMSRAESVAAFRRLFLLDSSSLFPLTSPGQRNTSSHNWQGGPVVCYLVRKSRTSRHNSNVHQTLPDMCFSSQRRYYYVRFCWVATQQEHK